MSDLDKYLLVCSPVPPTDSELESWRKMSRGVANVILKGNGSPWLIGDALARIAAGGRLGSDEFGRRAAGVVATTGQEAWTGRNGLVGAVCAMCAAIQVLTSARLTANAERRDMIAVALWSALSFQRQSAEPMLERLRQEVLESARIAALAMVEDGRRRRPVVGQASSAGVVRQNRALRANAELDREEIDVLRWTLADESTLLERDYREVASADSGALARGLELGLMLRRYPSFEHYELASRELPAGEDVGMATLIERLGADRELLAKPFRGSAVVEQCPAGFPLMTALGGGSTGGAAGAVARSREEWCGRALLESAAVTLAEGPQGGDE